MNIPILFDELAKIGAVSDEQAERALTRYETLERNKPTVGQVGRYGAIGAIATPAIGALGDAIAGKGFDAGKKLRGHLGRAVAGGLTASAIPIARAHMDRRAEMGTLKKYMGEHGVHTSHPTGGKLAEPFEPVEKTARRFAGAARRLLSEVDGRVVQQVQQEGAKRAVGHVRSKEKDSGMSGVTPARPFAAGSEYDTSLIKGAFATSAYSANIGYPTAPQRSQQPAFRPPSLGKTVQAEGEKAAEAEKQFKLQGHTSHQGMGIAIENRKGSVRKGVGKDGTPWRTEMKHPYGYIKGSKGADGEEVDCYVGPVKDAPHAHVVHQKKEDGSYDEDKVMLGFGSKKDAVDAYLAHYDSPKFLGPVKSLTVEKLRDLLATKKQLTKISELDLRALARTYADRIKAAAGAPTRGNFMMASEMPAFKAPTLKSPVQKLAAPTTPAGFLASAKRVGAPRVTAPPGPSIAQVAKPVGYGKPLSGAAKDTL